MENEKLNENYFLTNLKRERRNSDLCESLFAEAKKVLLNIILKKKKLISIYFLHTNIFTLPQN